MTGVVSRCFDGALFKPWSTLWSIDIPQGYQRGWLKGERYKKSKHNKNKIHDSNEARQSINLQSLNGIIIIGFVSPKHSPLRVH